MVAVVGFVHFSLTTPFSDGHHFPFINFYSSTAHRDCFSLSHLFMYLTAAWLVQLDNRQSAEWEAAGSSPGRTNTQGL